MNAPPAIDLRVFTTLDRVRGDLVVRGPLRHLPN